MKRVLVFGTFDIVHPGHISFLKQARRRGSWLIASVARDAYIRSWKGREPVHHEGQRVAQLLETGLVDEAHLSDEVVGRYEILDRARPDVICFGHDQDHLRADLMAWLSAHPRDLETHVLRPFHPEKYKSSKLLTEEARGA